MFLHWGGIQGWSVDDPWFLNTHISYVAFGTRLSTYPSELQRDIWMLSPLLSLRPWCSKPSLVYISTLPLHIYSLFSSSQTECRGTSPFVIQLLIRHLATLVEMLKCVESERRLRGCQADPPKRTWAKKKKEKHTKGKTWEVGFFSFPVDDVYLIVGKEGKRVADPWLDVGGTFPGGGGRQQDVSPRYGHGCGTRVQMTLA